MKKILLDILFGFIIFVSNIYGNSLDDVVIKNNKKTIDFLDSILKDEVYIKFLNTYPDERGEITNFDYKENMMDTIIQGLKSYGDGTSMRFLAPFYAFPKKLEHLSEEKRYGEVERFRLFTFRELHYLYNCILNSQKKCFDDFFSNFMVYTKDFNKRYKIK
ncbi:hypothetical protein [Borreliella bavariensis]|uniref:hypothetical protein n=1 Tax=Borreliella bavariensis TaxID=664662 RepID=UPI001C005595|nr:hypothetical protein [Borreliella bavariensis]